MDEKEITTAFELAKIARENVLEASLAQPSVF